MWVSPYCEQVPIISHALQRLGSSIEEGQAGARDQILDGARNEHFPGTCQSRYARSDVDGDAPELVAHDFALAGMQAGSHLDPERVDIVRNGAGTADGASGPVECRQKPVACGVNFTATEGVKFATNQGVMDIKQIVPAPITDARGFLCGPTMSVNSTVASTRSGSGRWRTPVRNSSISSVTASPSVSHGIWSGPVNSTFFAPGIRSAR